MLNAFKFITVHVLLVNRVARLGEKAPFGLLLAAVGSLKFGLCALLLFGLLFESQATTSGELRRVFAGYFYHPTVVKYQSIHRRKMDCPSSR